MTVRGRAHLALLPAALACGGGGPTTTTPTEPTADLDGDGYGRADCDQGDASIYPGAVEVPGNGVDEDCDGLDLATTGARTRLMSGYAGWGGSFGYSLATGDVDGDGLADVAASGTAWSVIGQAVQVYSSRTGAVTDLPYTLDGVWFGSTLSASVDLTGDGLADLVANESDCDISGARSAGAVRVYAWPVHTDGWVPLRPFTYAPGDVAAAVVGTTDSQFLGGYFGVLGGEQPGLCATVASDSMTFGCFSAPLSGTLTADAAQGTLAAPPGFSNRLVDAGDVDGDGVDDLAVDANDAGLAYLVPGPMVGDLDTVRDASAVFGGVSPADALGFGLRGLGDLDGDGYPELAVGAPFAEIVGGRDGRLYLFSAPFSPVEGAGTAIATVTSAGGDWLGYDAAVAADFDGDGDPALAISAPAYFGHGTGRIYMFDGVPTGAVTTGAAAWVLGGGQPDEGYGRALGLGDIDADGTVDLVSTADGATADGVSGPPDGAVWWTSAASW